MKEDGVASAPTSGKQSSAGRSSLERRVIQLRDRREAGLADFVASMERALGARMPAEGEIGQASWQAPPLSDAVLHEFRFSAPRSSTEVLYRVVDGVVQPYESVLLLAEGSQVSFDTYANSFYEHYWLRYAPVEDLTVRLFGVGDVVVNVFRGMPDRSDHRLGRQRLKLDPEAGAAVTVPLASSTAGSGRVFFEVTAIEDTVVLAGRLETAGAPTRPVRLGIGLCTFNRERMLAANLRRLVRSSYYRWASPRIVIVNQGSPFTSPEMAALLAAEEGRIEVIEQPNLGGAGGFTRAAMEIVRGGECTHVLFMDDDIEFDPAVLVTTHAFAARTVKPTVIGGAMIDLFRPSTMYEAGAVIGSDNILRAALHERPLDEPSTVDKLAREIPVHFNGWWYCAIPAEMFREHGLPLPIFIRGDDMEYGVRLAERGVPTVSLPPVAVWHEPFYAKAPSWQLYYDLRNRLIFAACHPEIARLDPPGVILRRVIDSLLKHDYMHTELIVRAVDDFLAGPAVLDTPMDALHREIAALAASRAPMKPASTAGMAPAAWRAPRRFLRPVALSRGLADLYRGRVAARPRPDIVFIDQWHPGMTMHVSQYALSDRMESYIQVYRYDREALRSGLRRGLAAVRRYREGAGKAAGEWRAAHGELASWERWERILNLRPAAGGEATGPVSADPAAATPTAPAPVATG